MWALFSKILTSTSSAPSPFILKKTSSILIQCFWSQWARCVQGWVSRTLIYGRDISFEGRGKNLIQAQTINQSQGIRKFPSCKPTADCGISTTWLGLVWWWLGTMDYGIVLWPCIHGPCPSVYAQQLHQNNALQGFFFHRQHCSGAIPEIIITAGADLTVRHQHNWKYAFRNIMKGGIEKYK